MIAQNRHYSRNKKREERSRHEVDILRLCQAQFTPGWKSAGWTCGTTLASAYVLCRLSAAWSQLQMKERKSKWM